MDVRVLIIDDSRAIREFVVDTLASWEGFVIREAFDGAEGLEMVQADPPDLILCDMEMPRLTGFQVVDALREQQINIPIILITSHGSEAIAVEFFRKGVKDYLIKPFTANEMQAAIDRTLTEVRLRQEKETLTQDLTLANQQLQYRVEELDALYQVGKLVTSMLTKEQLLEQILEAVFHIISAEEAALMLIDEESGRLQMELHRQQVPRETHVSSHPNFKDLVDQVARQGDAVVSRAMLAAPLKAGDKIIGVLSLNNPASGQSFSTHDQQLLLALVDYAAIGIENARLYDKVRQADQAKSEMLSLVVHELGTPVTSIVGPVTQQLERLIGSVLNNMEQAQTLISNLQTISHIETGQIHIEAKPIHLINPLQNALQATRKHISARSQQLTIKVPRNLPPVHADPARLKQILVNLLDNAYKYTLRGGCIGLVAWLQNECVYCAVSDTGPGISPEDQAKLFTKFFRSDDPTVQKVPGAGLGLCIVKNLVELQGGKVRAESQIGKGTTVVFTVPIAR
ncbi:MAG: hybrid sensor histidine kinase/response regulator [Chloroflexi bacterium]|nr:hybrid sensor histidine kinase/response regulator [Chloroflexota bacterium]